MLTWTQIKLLGITALSFCLTKPVLAAGLETLSKKRPEAPSSSQASSSATTAKPASVQANPVATPPKTVAPPTKPAPEAAPAAPAKTLPVKKQNDELDQDEDGEAKARAKTEAKPAPLPQSQLSKSLEGRLSLATSLGWAVVKPAKGTWIGVGASDLSARWRESIKGDGKVYITARYAPIAGVWTVNHRDYDTTLHGLYAGAEYQKSLESLGAPTLKAGMELGYMLVYAEPQDKAEAASDVKGGKVNLAAGGGLEWGILGDKVKVGPFARVHVAGFSIVNVGGSINFVF